MTRPTKSDDQRRSRVLGVRFTEAEIAELKRACQPRGAEVSTKAREVLLCWAREIEASPAAKSSARRRR